MRVVGFDPAFANFGIAIMEFDPATLKMDVIDLRLAQTEKSKVKTVRRSSDDLSRAQELYTEITSSLRDAKLCFAEIPSGSQTARASWGFGIAVGLLASVQIPLIQVQPSETKTASVGRKTATKPEMIAWATERYPDAPWLRSRGRIINDNEHLADAVAVIHAGILTKEYKALQALITRS